MIILNVAYGYMLQATVLPCGSKQQPEKAFKPATLKILLDSLIPISLSQDDQG